MKSNLRLISVSKDKKEWMNENQIFDLYKQKKRFIDITDGEISALYVSQSNTFPTELKYQNETLGLISQVSMTRMKDFLVEFSNFHTRYYNSNYGKKSAVWLLKQLKALPKHSNAIVEIFKINHGFPQFSIICKLSNPKEVLLPPIIISAHQDSVNQWNPWLGRSPGADDNGSGVTTIFEALRILLNSNFVPNRPLEFHFYAGEEGGLLGSQQIVKQYLNEKKQVHAILHTDMTGYSSNVVGLATDWTDPKLLHTLGLISNQYSGLQYETFKCGYGCSDHYSWNQGGYPTTFQSESSLEDSSPYIHTSEDTVDTLSFEHMSRFVNNVLGFCVELSFQ